MSAPTSTNPAGVPASPPRETRFTEGFQGQHGSYRTEVGAVDAPKRHSTLKKDSVSRKVSIKLDHSKKLGLNSIHSVNGQVEDRNSVFYTPIPVQGSPTDALADRFSAWRKVLKDFIAYFREVQTSYDNRAKGINKISQTLNTAVYPPGFARSGGILETNTVLRDSQKDSFAHVDGASKILAEIIDSLRNLRQDLDDKVKEIKGLSGDFKNTVEKEKEATRKEIVKLTDALTIIDSNPQGAAGKSDPYLIKLGLQKQLKHQIGEENHLHKAYLNIESSGCQLESIVVGEIQRAFGIYTKLLRREGEDSLHLAQRLEATTLQLPRDYEWYSFIARDPGMVDPSVPLRSASEIEYPGYKHPAALEVLSGLLERKSKYLKSYAPAWYALSPTHLHEFKTPDHTSDPTPVMSLYLPESTLGKHSEPGATSHKFILKARQTGHLHRDHAWVFRAESHEVMLRWYGSIKKLIEVSGEERNAFVEGTTHRRTGSATSSKDELETPLENDLENDEADEVPYSAEASVFDARLEPPPPVRPEGGRFPSDINVNRGGLGAEAASSDSNRLVISAAVGGSGPVEPNAQRPRSDSHSSTWSYDEKNPVHSTLDEEEEEFLPVGAEVPPAVERRMSVKHDYSREHEPRDQSYSTTAARRGPPSRKPTASYGIDLSTGQPDTGISQLANIDWANVIAGSENRPGSSHSISRKTPSRKPTAVYGVDPNAGHLEHHPDGLQRTTSENQPIRTEVSSSVTDSGTELTVERPALDRTESKSTISNLHVPGEYPKAV